MRGTLTRMRSMRENTTLIQCLILMLCALLITNTTLSKVWSVVCVCSSSLKHVFLCVCCYIVFLYLSLAYLMVTSCKGFSCVSQNCCVVFEVFPLITLHAQQGYVFGRIHLCIYVTARFTTGDWLRSQSDKSAFRIRNQFFLLC